MGATATEEEIRSAWRARALELHPDVGGTHSEMVELNAALESALRELHSQSANKTVTRGTRVRHRKPSHVSRDVSSFTIQELPVDAFETLTLVAAHCGQLLDDDPPYLIEFTLNELGDSASDCVLCRCELMPEAGGTTVHLSLSGSRRASIEEVRDSLVALINEMAD